MIGVVSDLSKIKSVQAVYLYGSHAKGNPKPYSDIDVCVLTDSDITASTRKRIVGYASRKIELTLYHELPLPLQYRIVKEGKVLFIRNEIMVRRHQNRAIKRYLDYSPRLMRQMKRVISRG